MEKPLFMFQDITSFSLGDVEKRDPRIDYITKLTLEVGSELPKGKYSLKLIKPFPPCGREGENLTVLKSLRAEEIESISAFRSSNGEKCARIEIHSKVPISVKYEQIEGIPGWNEKQS